MGEISLVSFISPAQDQTFYRQRRSQDFRCGVHPMHPIVCLKSSHLVAVLNIQATLLN